MATSLQTPTVLNQPFAQNGDKNNIPNTNDQSQGLASLSTGFPPITSRRIADGGKAVRRADVNGTLNLLSQFNYFEQNGGVYTFNPSVSNAIGGYPKNAVLWYFNSSIAYPVISLINNNTYNFVTTPSYIDNVHWAVAIDYIPRDIIQSTYATKSDLNTYATKSELNTYATKSDLNTYATKSELNLKADNSLVVHKAGNETITGGKTFSTSTTSKFSIDLNTTPSVDPVYQVVNWGKDTNDTALGVEHFVLHSTGNLEHTIDIRRTINGVYNSSEITCGITNTGVKYTRAPKSDEIDSIITTAGILKSATGYVQLGNGLTIQMGSNQVVANKWTINFKIPFQTTNYVLIGTQNGIDAIGNLGITSRTTTSASGDHYGNSDEYFDWIAIGF